MRAGNAKEKIVAMVGMVVGVTVFGYFMGAMGSMLSKMNTADVRIPSNAFLTGGRATAAKASFETP